MAEAARIEKFTPDELTTLRVDLLKSRTDAWQAAEMVSKFLAGRGYGVDTDAVRDVLPALAFLRGSHESMQSVLETVAYVM